MFLESKALPVRKADNLIAICEPIVYTGIPNISQPYRHPLRTVTEKALLFFFFYHELTFARLVQI
jgi:hypothetical protein